MLTNHKNRSIHIHTLHTHTHIKKKRREVSSEVAKDVNYTVSHTEYTYSQNNHKKTAINKNEITQVDNGGKNYNHIKSIVVVLSALMLQAYPVFTHTHTHK